MTRYALIAALAVLAATLGAYALQSGEVATLRADKASLTRSVATLRVASERAALAQAVADAHADRIERERKEMAARVEKILTTEYGGCADEAIDPDLLRDAGELWPAQD